MLSMKYSGGDHLNIFAAGGVEGVGGEDDPPPPPPPLHAGKRTPKTTNNAGICLSHMVLCPPPVPVMVPSMFKGAFSPGAIGADS